MLVEKNIDISNI